jgi:hypothetical protein
MACGKSGTTRMVTRFVIIPEGFRRTSVRSREPDSFSFVVYLGRVLAKFAENLRVDYHTDVKARGRTLHRLLYVLRWIADLQQGRRNLSGLPEAFGRPLLPIVLIWR